MYGEPFCRFIFFVILFPIALLGFFNRDVVREYLPESYEVLKPIDNTPLLVERAGLFLKNNKDTKTRADEKDALEPAVLAENVKAIHKNDPTKKKQVVNFLHQVILQTTEFRLERLEGLLSSLNSAPTILINKDDKKAFMDVIYLIIGEEVDKKERMENYIRANTVYDSDLIMWAAKSKNNKIIKDLEMKFIQFIASSKYLEKLQINK